LALLHCLRAVSQEFQVELHVAHLNHQLRGDESDSDARFVEWLAKEWNLPATLEARDVQALAREQRLSIEEAGRRARYGFLVDVAGRIAASLIAVGHHADDQVETVLMHMLRGAGLAGLRGMRYKTPVHELGLGVPGSNLWLVRPLLDVTREQVENYCRQNQLTPHYDRSNQEPTYFRNRLRGETLPYLETLNPNVRQTLVRASHALADEYDFLQSGIRSAYAMVARDVAGAIVFDRAAWRALHPALQRGTLRSAVHQLRGNLRNIDWTHIEDARRIALEKPAGARATLPDGLVLLVGYTDLTLAEDVLGALLPDLPLLSVERIDLPAQGATAMPDSDWLVESRVLTREAVPVGAPQRWTTLLDFEKCQGAVGLRRRLAGDRFQPAGLAGHTQSLHDFMINARIERAVRARVPLLVVDERIAWVCGWRVDERARVTSATREYWEVSFHKKESP
jgi:tRNA(Ile)-lysidine synthase